MKKIIIFILFIPVYLSSQTNLIIDTSFTVHSALKKEVKNYPFIKIVEPILPEGINALRNLTYIEYGERKLKLDIFFPNIDSSPKPGIILIHGGGWHTGDKSLQYPIAMKLANDGYITAAIEYRLSHEATFPAAVIDIKNAVKWLRKNAEKYNIDTNRIALLGCSAGGQLAALAGFSQNEKDFESSEVYPGFSSKVQAIINIDGLLDFLGKGSEEFDVVPDPQKPRSAHKWLGASQIERPDIWQKASAIYYVTAETPPIIFINSSRPRFHAGRDETIEKLVKYGVYYEVYTLEDTPHPFWLFHPWFNKTEKYVKTFLQKVFNN